MKYILASGSPRRQELLKQIDIPFEVITADVDESFENGLLPPAVVELLSRRKGHAVYDKIKNGLNEETVIISADTLVALDKSILGKPKDEQQAFDMLSALSGRSHFVYTGVTLIYHSKNGTKEMTF